MTSVFSSSKTLNSFFAFLLFFQFPLPLNISGNSPDLSFIWNTMAMHPKYIEKFLAAHQFMLRGPGPLKYADRHYIAIMVSHFSLMLSQSFSRAESVLTILNHHRNFSFNLKNAGGCPWVSVWPPYSLKLQLNVCIFSHAQYTRMPLSRRSCVAWCPQIIRCRFLRTLLFTKNLVFVFHAITEHHNYIIRPN